MIFHTEQFQQIWRNPYLYSDVQIQQQRIALKAWKYWNVIHLTPSVDYKNHLIYVFVASEIPIIFIRTISDLFLKSVCWLLCLMNTKKYSTILSQMSVLVQSVVSIQHEF